jgi:glycosyltransferase A (GT-A) superfamily protein (DUF2064 family)
VFDKLKEKFKQAICTHKRADSSGGSFIIKQTLYNSTLYTQEGKFEVIDRVAKCVACGQEWVKIPDWKEFKLNPGAPKQKIGVPV